MIHGDGEQSRDFTYVEDVADLVCEGDAWLLERVRKSVQRRQRNRYTLNEVWATLKRINGSNIWIRSTDPGRAGDVRHSQADTRAAVQ